ncbi:cytochrome P450 family protein [Dictyobacter arantiisoli]|uniref:Cytochrome P450 hydroxylase n=1 Tax=Dictyobacter arantiisoli TaxID=2014874 RepID=A0A5A5THE3_9CHLR|nr:cytochrome P450 [Dictyobacter arantiisoli]GCF10787.1 cytochrome P450 hydroxylase [Dictyobacter arantiisoli]
MVTEINLASPDFKANPYPTFTELRTTDPVRQTKLTNERRGWLVSRYEDADLVLRDPRFAKDIQHALTPEELKGYYPSQQVTPEERERMIDFSHNMLAYDQPDHTRLRNLVNLTFTPRLIERWRPRIQQIADDLLDKIQDRGEADLIAAYAFPIPMQVIMEMLGIKSEDRDKFHVWSNMIIEASGNPEEFHRHRADMMDFHDYLVQIINEKRADPADDLLSQLISVETAGDKMSEAELISMVSLLLIAGHETTVNLIGNGTLALLTHPDQKALLEADPGLMKGAIEEFLRFHGPLMTATQRWAREDLVLDGTQIKRGDYVMVLLASANHDPGVFGEAETLDIRRHDNRHLAFGKGIHYCLGAPLARLEGQIAIGTLLRRLPALQLSVAAEDLVWRPGALIMGLRTLPVTF